MNVIRKIEITEKQAEWIDAEIASGNISDEGMLIEEAIAERIHQKNNQNPKYREWLEAELQKGLDSGISEKSIDEIFAEARAYTRKLNGKV